MHGFSPVTRRIRAERKIWWAEGSATRLRTYHLEQQLFQTVSCERRSVVTHNGMGSGAEWLKGVLGGDDRDVAMDSAARRTQEVRKSSPRNTVRDETIRVVGDVHEHFV